MNKTRAPCVLVVDDTDVMRTLVRVHLSNAGYEVIVAEDAVEAGRALYESVPDLVIIDVEMPYMSGLEFVTKMQDDPTAPKVPVILMTAHERFKDQAQLLGVECLIKPFFADQLLDLVKRTLQPGT